MRDRVTVTAARSARPLAWTVLLPAVCVIGISQGVNPAAREIAAFRDAYARIEVNRGDWSGARAKTASRAFDAVVLALLNSNVATERIGAILAGLPGSSFYSASTVTGSEVVATWPEYRSSYTLLSVGVQGAPAWAAVSNFRGSPALDEAFGHVAVFERFEAAWRIADTLDAGNSLHAYPARGLPIPTLAVIDHYDAADGWLGSLQLWQVSGGRLSKADRKYGPLRFYEVQQSATGPRVKFSEFPTCLGLSVSQLSSSTFELQVDAIAEAPRVRTRTTTPWVVAVDAACTAIRGKTSLSIDKTSGAIAAQVFGHPHVMIWNAEGDENAGKGSVLVTADTEKFFRFDVTRAPDGVWRIVRVVETTGG